MSLLIELPVTGPFSLEASTRFLEGFSPAGAFATSGAGRELALAFPVEGDWRTAGAVVRQDGERVVAEVHGAVDDGGRRLAAFPPPQVLRDLEEIDGVPARELPWLRGIADAALAGTLDGARLRALEPERALAELRELAGVGPFAAELVLVRGAQHPDVFPAHERRLHQEITRAYELEAPTPEQLERVAERWRPYRSWVSLLLRAARAEPAAGIEPATS